MYVRRPLLFVMPGIDIISIHVNTIFSYERKNCVTIFDGTFLTLSFPALNGSISRRKYFLERHVSINKLLIERHLSAYGASNALRCHP